jgi:hypothetical protein
MARRAVWNDDDLSRDAERSQQPLDRLVDRS